MDHGFGADEKARNFGFVSRGHNKLDYLGGSENRAISGRDRGFLWEHDLGDSAAEGFYDIEVGSIWVAGEHHSTSSVEDAIVRVSGYIIEELEKGSIGIFCGRSLLLAELVDTNNAFFINSWSVV